MILNNIYELRIESGGLGCAAFILCSHPKNTALLDRLCIYLGVLCKYLKLIGSKSACSFDLNIILIKFHLTLSALL